MHLLQSFMFHLVSVSALPIAVQRGLEEMSKDLNSINPAFTIRRHIHQAQEEVDTIQQLRNVGFSLNLCSDVL